MPACHGKASKAVGWKGAFLLMITQKNLSKIKRPFAIGSLVIRKQVGLMGQGNGLGWKTNKSNFLPIPARQNCPS